PRPRARDGFGAAARVRRGSAGPSMKVVLGLGNPGPEYADTRHNVGWWLLDHLASRWKAKRFERGRSLESASARVGGEEVRLVKPLTYMNRSGLVARALAGEVDVGRDLLVLVDDAALPPSSARMRAQGSAGGHNGLLSIEGALGTAAYPRLRIGVGGPPPGVELAEWVLSPFDAAEDEERVLAILPRLADGVEVWVREGVERAMNVTNR
ncbi:MAG: aminoacyl-tRNA hydrolase, partial [Gemmatimonadota bacterium]